MRNLFKKNESKKDGGYTLLFAVLVTSLVLSIGISILSISKKEFLLSSSARDSSSALYAADSGIECAVYSDEQYDLFSTTTTPTGSFACGQAYSDVLPPDLSAGRPGYTFSVKFGDDSSCATVTVTKQYVGNELDTIIDSRGYNLGWDAQNTSCDAQSPKKVERGLRLSY